MGKDTQAGYKLDMDLFPGPDGNPMCGVTISGVGTSFRFIIPFDRMISFGQDFADNLAALHKAATEEMAKSALAVPDKRLIVPNGHGPRRR